MPEDRQSDLSRWFMVLLGVGVLWRLVRYAVAMPVWGDEAGVGLNIITRDYAQLLRPLDFDQVAPLGFLWCQRAAYQLLGMSEYAVRLIPTLAGLATLLLFAAWTRLILPPWPRTIAIGLIAVSTTVVSCAVELKPYGIDLLASVALLLPATLFLLRHQIRWLALLIVLAPVALFMSYPAAFIAGGVGLALVASLRRWSWGRASLVAVYGIILLGAFVLLFRHVADGQYHRTAAVMTNYWSDAFPPANPLRFVWWLVETHTGRLMDYPAGDKNGGSTLSCILFVLGLAAWWKSRPAPLTWLLLGPFLLSMLAAAMHRYPYGGSSRVDQHLAPAIIVLIALGLAWLVDRLATKPQTHRLVQAIVFFALLAIGLGGTVFNVIWPYRIKGVSEARRIVRQVLHEAGPEATIVVVQERVSLPKTVQWYLLERNEPIEWSGAVDPSWQQDRGALWVLNFEKTPGFHVALESELGRKGLEHPVPPVYLYGTKELPLRWEFDSFAPVGHL